MSSLTHFLCVFAQPTRTLPPMPPTNSDASPPRSRLLEIPSIEKGMIVQWRRKRRRKANIVVINRNNHQRHHESQTTCIGRNTKGNNDNRRWGTNQNLPKRGYWKLQPKMNSKWQCSTHPRNITEPIVWYCLFPINRQRSGPKRNYTFHIHLSVVMLGMRKYLM